MKDKIEILLLILFIIFFIIGAKNGYFSEVEELEETRSHYNEIYGEAAQYFIFSK